MFGSWVGSSRVRNTCITGDKGLRSLYQSNTFRSTQSSPVLRSAGVHAQQQEQYSVGHASSLPKALQPNCTAAVACISACSSVLSCYLFTAPDGGKLFADSYPSSAAPRCCTGFPVMLRAFVRYKRDRMTPGRLMQLMHTAFKKLSHEDVRLSQTGQKGSRLWSVASRQTGSAGNLCEWRGRYYAPSLVVHSVIIAQCVTSR